MHQHSKKSDVGAFFVIVYTKDTCVIYDIKNETYETG